MLVCDLKVSKVRKNIPSICSKKSVANAMLHVCYGMFICSIDVSVGDIEVNRSALIRVFICVL